jgi:site-specific recombinase XerD
MTHHFYPQPEDLDRLRRGPLGAHLDGFAYLLVEQGYSRQFGRQKIRLVADLSQWLEHKHIKVEGLNERCAAAFLKARWKRLRRRRGDQSTLAAVLRHLRHAEVIPAIVSPASNAPIDRLERDYARFLTQERGLSQATLDNYLPTARRFLASRFGAGRTCLDKLRSHDVTAFVLRDTSALSRKRVQLTTSALRSFLGFLYQRGELTANLAASVPAVASWRLSDLPQFLEPEQVEDLLRSCDQGSPSGRRDYAVLLLLARLGLRGGEVVHLTLDDINWEAGELLIRGKSAREDRLPLPHDVGRALAKYLQKGRPDSLSRRVFIRTKAPRQGFSGSAAICGIVERALARAQIPSEHKGAHVLRHSLATKMLRAGASLTQIGQILRHQRAQTTEIYAKVDLTALRALAQPWPGGAQ